MFKLKKAFTIIELLVVVAIIGVLAAVVIISVEGAQSKGRDTRRVSDLAQARKAFQMYYERNGTFQPSTGYGYSGGIYDGQAWFNATSADSPTNYASKSVAQFLVDQGLVSNIIIDPTGDTFCSTSGCVNPNKYAYMFYCRSPYIGDCKTKASMYAKLENPTADQLSTLPLSAWGTGSTGTPLGCGGGQSCGMNYADTIIP